MSYQCMTTEKVIALTRGTFVGRVMSLLFNILSSLVIAFLPRSKHLLMCCCFCSLTQFSPTICDSMDCSTPRCPVLHHLLELAQTYVHWVCNVIQPSCPLSTPSPLALNLSQHQGLFQWVSSLYQVAKYQASTPASVLPMNIQDWFLLGLTGLVSLQSEGLSRVFSNTTTWKHQFFDLLYAPSLTSMHDYWKNCSLEYTDVCLQRNVSLICCLGWSLLLFPGASVFWFHHCSHHLRWFWSPRK